MKGHLTEHMNKARDKRIAIIRDKRLNKGWTQEDIAKHLGISRQRVGIILQKEGIKK
jgi:DNA-binding transcriptional regulator LsrR (DeoR family)